MPALVQLCRDRAEPDINESVGVDGGQSRLVFVPLSKVSETECIDGQAEFNRGFRPSWSQLDLTSSMQFL